jgi:hypothetical protein
MAHQHSPPSLPHTVTDRWGPPVGTSFYLQPAAPFFPAPATGRPAVPGHPAPLLLPTGSALRHHRHPRAPPLPLPLPPPPHRAPPPLMAPAATDPAPPPHRALSTSPSAL